MSGERLEIGADGLVRGVGEQQEQELLPCPFCGGVDGIYIKMEHYLYSLEDTNINVNIGCDTCDLEVETMLDTAEEAITWWNKRAESGAQDLANLLKEAITLLKLEKLGVLQGILSKTEGNQDG